MQWQKVESVLFLSKKEWFEKEMYGKEYFKIWDLHELHTGQIAEC